MKLKRSIVLSLACLVGAALAPVPAAAQQTAQLRLVNWGNSGTINTTRYGVVEASPYQGYFAGDPTTPLIDFYCIDFEHYAPSLGYNMNVQITNLGLGDVSLARHGGEAGALSKYQQIAWLIGQRPQVDATNWRAIQLAVWQTFSGSCADVSLPFRACARYGDAGLNTLANNWRTAAVNGAAAMSVADFDQFKIVTGYAPDGNRQEYMYVTPEPETYALIGMGLLMMFLVWRRGRRRNGEAAFGAGLA